MNECCCGFCTYASAVTHTGIDPFNFDLDDHTRCLVIFGGICCEVVPCQSLGVRTIARLEIAKKYEIKEDLGHSILVECCCPCCADWQVQNEIVVRERLTYGCAKFEKVKEVTPAQMEMQR